MDGLGGVTSTRAGDAASIAAKMIFFIGASLGSPAISFSRLVDLVEHAAIGEMRRLRLAPAAEIPVDGDQGNGGKRAAILGQDRDIARAVEILRLDLLRLRRIEEIQDASAALRVPRRSAFLSSSATAGSARMEREG